MFYKKYDEISKKLTKFLKTKNSFKETAAEFADLGKTLDEENPFECGLVALAKFGEMRCWQKYEDKQKTVRTAVRAARLFVKSATFNYSVSKNLRDTWSDPLADGLHCYSVAVDILKADKKPNLAVVLLLELGKTEAQFNLHHYAGSTYRSAVELCKKEALSLPLLFDSAFNSIESYCEADRLDLALEVVKDVLSINDLERDATSSQLMKNQLNDIKIVQAQLLLSSFQYEKCAEAYELFDDENIKLLFSKLCDATKNNSIAEMDALLSQVRQSNYFTDLQKKLFERHYQLLSKSIEEAFNRLKS